MKAKNAGLIVIRSALLISVIISTCVFFTEASALTPGSKVWEYATGNTVYSSPTIAGGYVYVGSDDYKVYCLNAQTGAKIWEYATGGLVGSSPAVANGYVYVGSDDYKVYCLNAQTGAKVWEYATSDIVESSPAVANGYVYVGSDDAKVYCLNAQTGAKVWDYTTSDVVESTPTVAGGYVYVGSEDWKVYCLNAQTGAKVWEYATGDWVYSSPAVSGGHVYIGSNDNKVYCLNAQTGVKVWDYTTGDDVGSTPAVAGGYVYVGSNDKKVYCLNAQTGVKVWEYATTDIVQSSPAIAGGYVYVGSDNRRVYCLNAQTGAKVWDYLTGDIVESSPAVSNGYVYVGSYDGKVYCLTATEAAGSWPMFKNNNLRSGNADSDNDGIEDIDDNCPTVPNGPALGTCMPGSDKAGTTCTSDADCVIGCSSSGSCSMNQEDSDANGIGDVCDINLKIHALVREYYLNILGREPDAAGWDYWTNEIKRIVSLGIYVGEGFQAQARFFFNSSEYLNKNTSATVFVTDLYHTFLQREPDAAGLTYWVGQLGCLTRNMLITQFAYSNEFKQLMTDMFGADTTRPENNLLNDFYRGFLNRFPDDGGFNDYLTQMRQAQCTGPTAVKNLSYQIALSFVQSAEYAARNRNNTGYVEDLYNGILRRGGDCAGFLDWVSSLNSGTSRANILKSFTDSTEFQTRVNAVIAAGCLP